MAWPRWKSLDDLTAYEVRGYKNRHEYFRRLANRNNVDIGTVYDTAARLGQDEDFGELPKALRPPPSPYQRYFQGKR